jgi:hypothetical protein
MKPKRPVLEPVILTIDREDVESIFIAKTQNTALFHGFKSITITPKQREDV